MKVLAVSIPFQTIIERFLRRTFTERLSDSQSSRSRMLLPFLLTQTADPAAPGIVRPMPAEDVMHLINELQCELAIIRISGSTTELQEIANCKRIRP